ncbi:olfactory receptor 6F1-like [Rhinophrynus dorsalis]
MFYFNFPEHYFSISTNQTFILMGFILGPGMQTCIFLVFLVIYSMSLIGNIAIIAAILLGKHLHNPMYFFLSSLAILDIFFISCTVLKLLIILGSDNKAISLTDCIIQLYFYMSLGCIEFNSLAVMSVDRYIAISQPLRYHSIMTKKISLWLILLSWVLGFFPFIYPIVLLSHLSFCGPFELNHFFCECSALVKISCSDTRFFDLIFSTSAAFIVLSSFTVTAVSYSHILTTIMRIPSSSGKRKAFSTCASHFIGVSLAYGTVMFLYVRSVESSSPELNKVVTILNSILTPLSNPFIYTLRNKQVQKVLWVSIKKYRV